MPPLAPASAAACTPARPNARATVRYRCAPASFARVYLGEDHEFQKAWLLNLSTTGVGLTVTRPIGAGLQAVLLVRANDGERVYRLPVRTVHCSEQPHLEWFVGCEFLTPLSADDLENLL